MKQCGLQRPVAVCGICHSCLGFARVVHLAPPGEPHLGEFERQSQSGHLALALSLLVGLADCLAANLPDVLGEFALVEAKIIPQMLRLVVVEIVQDKDKLADPADREQTRL